MRVFTYIFCFMFALMMMASTSYAQSQYTGPKQLTTSQMNPTGSCNCGEGIGGGVGGGVGGGIGGGNPLSSAIAFVPILSVIIKSITHDRDGNVIDIEYEDLVAVVEMEKVANDYYVRMFEVKAADTNSFIAGRDKPGNIYYVMGAAEFLENNGEGGTDVSEALPDGVDIQELQVFELPPEDTYHYMFFVGAEGNYTDKQAFLSMFQ